MAEVGLRVNETCKLDLADVRWDLGRFGKLHVRHGRGARGSGPRERMVPLINNAGATLRWFVEDVWAQFGDDHAQPGVPLLPSERKNADGSAARVGDEALRAALAGAARAHLPDWPDVVTPHVLRYFCASQPYLVGMDLIAIQATLGHAWIVTTTNSARARPGHPCRGRVDRGPAACRRAAEGTEQMIRTEQMIINLAAGHGSSSSSISAVMGPAVVTRHVEQNRIVRALLPGAYRTTSQRELP